MVFIGGRRRDPAGRAPCGLGAPLDHRQNHPTARAPGARQAAAFEVGVEGRRSVVGPGHRADSPRPPADAVDALYRSAGARTSTPCTVARRVQAAGRKGACALPPRLKEGWWRTHGLPPPAAVPATATPPSPRITRHPQYAAGRWPLEMPKRDRPPPGRDQGVDRHRRYRNALAAYPGPSLRIYSIDNSIHFSISSINCILVRLHSSIVPDDPIKRNLSGRGCCLPTTFLAADSSLSLCP